MAALGLLVALATRDALEAIEDARLENEKLEVEEKEVTEVVNGEEIGAVMELVPDALLPDSVEVKITVLKPGT
ncbi:hypothetical protein RhiLY_11652 [Ceratobasidium sp. AG-Ba]|nr:hypothetical protein RhiLY_11652 [Ceratobasidium sp. AG-Ba]